MAYRRFKLNRSPDTPPSKTQQVAAALQYDPDRDAAPRVVASGQWKVAEQILEVARQHNIPVYEDTALAAALSTVNVGEEIPPELYLVVAEVLAYLYRVAKIKV